MNPKTEPERKCILTREVKAEKDLIRFVLSPEGIVTPDIKRKLPGRGAWVSLSRAQVQEAMKSKAFQKALDEKAYVPENLAEVISTLMRADMVQALSLCRKAGLATKGFMKVEDALRGGKVSVLIHAKEAAEDGSLKLNRLCGPNVAILDLFARSELDLAFGGENVIHAALIHGGQTRNLLDFASRLAQYDDFEIKGLN